jgi:hypothetical protein
MIEKIKLIFTILISVFLTIIIVFFLIGYFFPPKAGLLVVSNPKADVFIDGVKVGETPYDAALKPKEVLIKIAPLDPRLTSYETRVRLVAKVKTVLQRDLAESDEKSSGILVSFEKAVGKNPVISVISDPDKAQVKLDDQVRGFTPLELGSIDSGEHKLSLSLFDFMTKEVNIRTYPGYKLTAFFKLAPAPPQEQTVQKSLNFKVQIVKVGKDGLNVREKPDLSSSEVGQVKEDEEYSVLEETENKEWYRIGKEDVNLGWIPSQYTKKIEGN